MGLNYRKARSVLKKIVGEDAVTVLEACKNKPVTDEFMKANYKISIADMIKKLLSFEKKFSEFDMLKQFFKLSPPVGGFERGGIKKSYSIGGVLGYRGKEINKLLKKMM